ncbi:MAG: acyltransferase family protein [Bacteroidota bacterium]|nr:acyltransferase family protein [Bacteroidota bacterium]
MPQTTIPKQRIIWPDNLRALATVAVVVLHVSSSILYEWGKVSSSDWWTGNIYDSLVRWCVPVFLMVTGALLIPKQDTFAEIIANRIGKLIVPFAFWSLIYLINSLYIQIIQDNEMSISQCFVYIAKSLYHGTSYHLWYIYVLLGIYLLLPTISKNLNLLSDKNLLYIILLWMLILCLNYIPSLHFKPLAFVGYVGYAVFGFYLFKVSINNIMAFLMLAAGLAITAYGTFYLSNQQKGFNEMLYNYNTPHIAIMAAGVFILAKNETKNYNNKWFVKIRNVIAQKSLGVYLIHVLILEILNKFGIDWFYLEPLLSIPFTAMVCLIISTTIVYYGSKSQVGKYIFG